MDACFAPTRIAALEKLARFVPLAGRDYAARRNYDLGPGQHLHVSTLSPYLRCRLLTEEEVLQTVLSRHSVQAAEKFIQEVYWRTYWKGWLELRPGIWRQYQHDLSRAWDSVQTQSGLRSRWEEACKGETGIDCFDAWAHELAATGYLHNHARMWFASIWVFTLELPWELGADFFLRHLLDGDPASNTLSWRWVSGIQTQGKTYLARTSNISKFTEGRFHPKWQLAGEAIPRASASPPPPRFLPQSDAITAGARTALLLHEEDLSPAFMMQDIQPVACAVLQPQLRFGPLQTATQVDAFRAKALEDAATRWQSRSGSLTHVADGDALALWAKDAGVDQIVTAYAPTGPVAEALACYDNISDAPPLRRIMRAYDRAAWPHATKGFFAFKKHIPALLENLPRASAA